MYGEFERKVWVLNQAGDMGRGEGVINGTITLVDEQAVPIDFGGSGATAWSDITGVPAYLTAAQAAGTASIRAIGTTATTAAAGNHTHVATQITDTTSVGRSVMNAADAAAARTAIGAGTSSLVIGTTAGTAKDGAYQPAWNAVTGKPALLTQAAGVPASATAAGTAGQYYYTDDTFYLCVATNTWRKVSLEAW